MMPSLIKKDTQQVIARSVYKASNLWEKTKGLLGQEDMPASQAFWLTSCASVHTFFMKFSIDVIFVDKNLKITSIAHSVPPFRIVSGTWKTSSTFELKANQLNSFNLKKGDELYVGN